MCEQRRYRISPNLDVSYISVCKGLYIAHTIAGLELLKCSSVYSLLKQDGIPNICAQMTQISGTQLASLPLLPYSGNSALSFPEPTQYHLRSSNSGFLLLCHPSELGNFVTAQVARRALPNLTAAEIRKQYKGPTFQLGNHRYRLHELAEISIRKYGSIEAFQTALLSNLLQVTPDLVRYLPYQSHCRRLSQLADSYHDLKQQEPHLRNCLLAFGGIMRTRAHNDHLSSRLEADVRIQLAANVARRHSALRLYIKGTLQINVDEYFGACLDYYGTVCADARQSMQKRRSHLQTAYSSLGPYLESLSSVCNTWTKAQLFHAMMRCGGMLSTQVQCGGMPSTPVQYGGMPNAPVPCQGTPSASIQCVAMPSTPVQLTDMPSVPVQFGLMPSAPVQCEETPITLAQCEGMPSVPVQSVGMPSVPVQSVGMPIVTAQCVQPSITTAQCEDVPSAPEQCHVGMLPSPLPQFKGPTITMLPCVGMHSVSAQCGGSPITTAQYQGVPSAPVQYADVQYADGVQVLQHFPAFQIM